MASQHPRYIYLSVRSDVRIYDVIKSRTYTSSLCRFRRRSLVLKIKSSSQRINIPRESSHLCHINAMEPDHAMTTKNVERNDGTLSERSNEFMDFFEITTALPSGDDAFIEGDIIEDSFFKAIFKPFNLA